MLLSYLLPLPCTTDVVDASHWMGNLIDEGYGNTPFPHLLMLGTHNSGYHEQLTCGSGFLADVAKEYAQCQQVNLQQQLDLGVRFFDIRIECDGGGSDGNDHLDFSHGICNDGDPETEIRQVHAWLVAHPQEVVVMSFRGNLQDKEKSVQCQSQFDNVLNLFQDLAWDGESWPTLETMVANNQRAVLIKYEYEVTNLPFVLDRFNLYEHTWSDTHTDDPEELVTDIISFIDRQTTSSLPAHKIWDVNMYASPEGLGATPQQLARNVNPRIPNVMTALERARSRQVYFNALLVDYAGSYTGGYNVVQAIYEYNKLVAA